MEPLENVRDIFGTLHDGIIKHWVGDKNKLTLRVDCQYLAELIDPSFEDFYLELEGITRFAFVPWMNSDVLEQEYYAELDAVFKGRLFLLYAEIDTEFVKISCHQGDPALDYCGGTLYLNCNSIKMFDQVKREVTVEYLDKLCNENSHKFEDQK